MSCKILDKIAGDHVIKLKENVIGVVLKDFAAEKVGKETDVMVHLVEKIDINVY